MAGDSDQFEYAARVWAELDADQSFSLPARCGKVAILCGTREGDTTADGLLFGREARQLANICAYGGGFDVELALGASNNDMTAVLQDPSVSEVITIGHGTFSHFNTVDGQYDWCDVSADADHLKQGLIIMRQCGVMWRRLNVPFPLFAVRSASQIMAVMSAEFDVDGLSHPSNDSLELLDLPRVSYRAVLEQFPLNRKTPEVRNAMNRLIGWFLRSNA